jgi:hypothetical protein
MRAAFIITAVVAAIGLGLRYLRSKDQWWTRR